MDPKCVLSHVVPLENDTVLALMLEIVFCIAGWNPEM